MRHLVPMLVVGLLVSIGLSGCTDAPTVATECRGDANDPHPGDMICYSGTLDSPLKITAGGTPEAPIVYAGGGDIKVCRGSGRRPTTW